ncbi:caspase-6 protein [Thalictrum thalictroides]|uniref:Caspase-6 protein n=1 Tax=Thalictrum thalictroides TaxID=46969 RepID=A0A7J6V1Q4_THATH|nr:caspase-6 protein [Thalictrum thalictroides]
MAWRRCESLSRSILSTARSSSIRSSSAPLPRLHSPPPFASPRFQTRRLSFSNPRIIEELRMTQSLLPLYSVAVAARLTSYLAVDVRACCELSQGKAVYISVDEMNRLMIRLNTVQPNEEDARWRWEGGEGGEFGVSLFCERMTKDNGVMILPSKLIWVMEIPYKIKIFC